VDALFYNSTQEAPRALEQLFRGPEDDRYNDVWSCDIEANTAADNPPQEVEDTKTRRNKQIAHLTYTRADYEPTDAYWRWPFDELLKPLLKRIVQFCESLAAGNVHNDITQPDSQEWSTRAQTVKDCLKEDGTIYMLKQSYQCGYASTTSDNGSRATW
jgi:hypothetical protein